MSSVRKWNYFTPCKTLLVGLPSSKQMAFQSRDNGISLLAMFLLWIFGKFTSHKYGEVWNIWREVLSLCYQRSRSFLETAFHYLLQLILVSFPETIEFRRKRLWYSVLFNLVVTIWCILIHYLYKILLYCIILY